MPRAGRADPAAGGAIRGLGVGPGTRGFRAFPCGPDDPLAYEIGLRFQLSLQVAVMATLASVLLAIPLGTVAAMNRDTWLDYGVRAFSIAGLATPSFWLGILIILALLNVTQAFWGTPWMPPILYRRRSGWIRLPTCRKLVMAGSGRPGTGIPRWRLA